MGYNPDGSFTLNQTFGTGTAPDNQFPPAVGDTLDDIAAGIDVNSIVANPAFTSVAMLRANNLSDVANPTTALANLDAQLTSNIRQNIQNGTYTLVATDAEKMILVQNPNNAAWTIPSNASVPYPAGTAITFVSRTSGTCTISINSDILVFANGTSSLGTRTLAPNCFATAIKTESTVWLINGSGLT